MGFAGPISVHDCRSGGYTAPRVAGTVSLLPWFLLPRFQYSLALIIDSLRNKRAVYRQLLQQWRRRFWHNANAILALLRDLGFSAWVSPGAGRKSHKTAADHREHGTSHVLPALPQAVPSQFYGELILRQKGGCGKAVTTHTTLALKRFWGWFRLRLGAAGLEFRAGGHTWAVGGRADG
jgi:hypothetical protein